MVSWRANGSIYYRHRCERIDRSRGSPQHFLRKSGGFKGLAMKQAEIPALKDVLLRKLRNRDALIAVVGMGYVGLPLALRYAEVGYGVLGIDIDPAKVQALNAGRSYIEHIPGATVAAACAAKFEATEDFQRCVDADALIICVPTPLDQYREPNLSYVIGLSCRTCATGR